MEIQVNDLVEVQYHNHLLVGQVYKIYLGMEQYDVMLPELGIKRFPGNCITRRIAREKEETEVLDQESSEQADATGDNGADIVGLLTSFNNDLPTSQSELPSTDGPAAESDSFGGGGGFSGGGGGDSWGGSYGESDSSSDTGSSDSGFGGSEGAE